MLARAVLCGGLAAPAGCDAREPDRAAPALTPSASPGAPAPSAPAAPSASPGPAPPAAAEPREAGPRIYAKARFAWIQAEPHASQGWLGYLSLGGSVALRGGSVEAARVAGAGCEAWYAVEPRGYVCAGDSATVDPKDPVVVALAADAPRLDSPWPFSYGESLGAPRYAHAPTPAEQRQAEWDLDAHLAQVERARRAASPEDVEKELVGVDLGPAGVALPELLAWSPLVRESRSWVATGSTVAFVRAFDLAGRTFLVTSDHALVPSDRVRPYPQRAFHGVDLGPGAGATDAGAGATDAGAGATEVALPIAFFRKKPRPRYRRAADGTFAATQESWPVHGWVALTGESVEAGAQRFLATREGDAFVLETDASVARRAALAPFTRQPAEGDRRTWLDVSVLDGTLVAYEGLRPVFATLISPGRGGIPYEGHDPLETASTPTGTFRVDGKFATATMVSSTNDLIVHTEVQFVQNFHGPHALHGAYWHDGWGEPKSGGCINLAPTDAKRLFEWSEPHLPDGWYGMRSVPEAGPATVVVVHR